jgi:hypothetical protein
MGRRCFFKTDLDWSEQFLRTDYAGPMEIRHRLSVGDPLLLRRVSPSSVSTLLLVQRLDIGLFQSPKYGKDGYHYADDHIVPHSSGDVSIVERKRCHNKPQAQDEINPA